MRNFFTAILFPITFLIAAPCVFGQISNSEIPTISLKNGTRHQIELMPGLTKIKVTGLSVGQKHYILVNTKTLENPNQFRVRVLENAVEEAAKNDPETFGENMRAYFPTDTAQEFSVACLVSDFFEAVPVVVSVYKQDDIKIDGNSEWFQDFQKRISDLTTKNQPANPPTSSQNPPNLTVATAPASVLITDVLVGGGCFGVSGITSSGHVNSRGTFANGQTTIGFNNGMVMSCAPISFLPGPNSAGGAGGFLIGDTPDDPDLLNVGSGNQFDLSKIEFDFEPTANTVEFEFVFGSEEYCEWANTNFNDVFGFFISGPGIVGNQNIAVLPGGAGEVSINNVNQFNNTGFYVNNNNGGSCNGLPPFNMADIQLDGFTVQLTATATVQECETYHLKLAIADRGDAIFGSAVFLKANSFSAGSVVSGEVVVPGIPNQTWVYENCGEIFIKFIRNGGDINTEENVDITILPSSTAEGFGVDYWNLPEPLVIPPGATFILVPISVIADGIAEGDETIEILINSPCFCADPIIITIKDIPPIEPNLEDLDLCGVSSTTLNPAPTGGHAPYSYVWGDGESTPTLFVNQSGTYTVTITDDCGGTATDEATVTISPLSTATLTGSGSLCAGQTGSFNLTITLVGAAPWDVEIDMNGTPTSYTFTSSPGIINVTEPGTYSITSVSTNGCDGTPIGEVTIAEIEIVAELDATEPACGTINNGSITATGSGGSAPYGYVWNTGALSQTINNLPLGTYTVTVVDAGGCSATAETTLTQPPPLLVSVNSTTNLDCNNPIGSIDLQVDGGSPSYDFNWSNGSSDEDPEITAGGTFTVTVTDDNGCTKTTSATVSANLTLPIAVANAPGLISCTNNTITINGNGSSTGASFTYQWDGPSFVCCETTLNPQVDQGGTYTLTVTNSINGCTKEVTVNVNENTTLPEVNLNVPNNIACTSPQITISGVGSTTGAGIVYQWTAAPGNIVSGGTTLNPVVNQAGTYTLVITNNLNGCTAEGTATVEGNTILPIAVIAPPSGVNCTNPELDLDASGSSGNGPINFNWNATGGGNIVSGDDTATPTIDEGGTYIVTVTDSENGCTATAQVVVAESFTPPLAVANTPGLITCANPQITINGNGSSVGGNFNYDWDGPGIVSGNNTLNPIVDAAGTYTLTVTNTTNGCTAEDEVTINESTDFPEVNLDADEISCDDPTISISGSGSTTGAGINYLWTTADGNIVSGGTTLNPTVNLAGTYTLVITNSTNGCTADGEITVDGNTIHPTAQIAPPDVVNCFFPEIQLDASNSTSNSGSIDFSWTASPGNISSGDDSANPFVDEGGTYFVTITDPQNNCTSTASITVSQNLTPPNAAIAAPPELDCDNPTILLNANGSSNGANFSAEWWSPDGNIMAGANTLMPEVDQAGTYILTITNEINGCTAENEVEVEADQDLPQADAGSDEQLDCSQLQINLDGTASTTGVGIVFQWSTADGNIVSGANSLSPLVNQSGFYTLVVMNSSTGCSSEASVFVNDNIIYPEANALPPDPLNCNTPIASINGLGSSLGSEFEYVWTTTNGFIENGEDSLEPEVSAPGTYTLVITNQDNFCTATTQVVVDEDIATPFATAQALSNLTCQFPQVQLSGNGSSDDGGSTFVYQWTTSNGNIVSGATNLNCTVNQPGTYILQVSNLQNGCTDSAPVSVTTNQTFPTVAVAVPDVFDCNTNTMNLNAAGSSAGNNFAYVWATSNGNIVSGGTTLNPTIDQPGVYDFTVVNTQSGCTSTVSITVSTNYNAPTAVAAPGGILSCTVNSLILNGNGSSTGNNFTYNWTTVGGNILSDGTTLNPSVNAVGTYILEITNSQNGCTSTATTTVSADANLPQANAGQPDTLTCFSNQIQIAATASQGNDFAYVWTGPGIVNGQGTLNLTVNQPGQYHLLVTNNLNGCTANSSVQIGENQALPLAEAGLTDELTCIKTTVILDAAGTSTGSNFNYIWTSPTGNLIVGATTLTPQISQPGTYNLLVTNTENGCTSTDAVVIFQNISNPTADAGAAKQIDCQNPTVNLSGTGSTGANFSYLWTSPNGNIANGATTLNPTIDAAGTYNLLITNNLNGCTATDFATVSKDANLPVALGVPSGKLTCAVKNISINATTSSQGAGFTFNWTTTNGNFTAGQNTLSPTVNQPGQYILTILNTSNNCDATATVNVEIDTISPAADAGAPAVISCAVPILTLDGSNSSLGNQFSYNWTTQNGQIVSGNTTLNPTVNESGFYEIEVLDKSNGCTNTATVQILRDQNTPEADAGAAKILTCTAATLNLDGSLSSQNPTFIYQWTTVGGNILSGANTLNPQIDKIGTYNLLITNPINGCTDLASVTVTQDKVNPLAAVAAPPILNCELTEAILNTAGSSMGNNFNFTWTTVGGNILSGGTSGAPKIDAPGTYNLLITNTVNGCTATATTTVSEDVNLPIVDAGQTSVLSCSSPTFTLAGSATNAGSNFSINWSTPNGNIVSGATTLTPIINASGNYILTVVNNLNKCQTVDNVQITQDASLPISVAATTGVLTCSVLEVNLTGAGSSTGAAFSYEWTTQTGSIVSGGTTLNPTVSEPGQYFLTVKNTANDCETIGSVTVLENILPPTALAAAPVTLTCSATSIKLDGAGSATGSQFSYFWTTVNGIIFSGGTTLTPTVTAAGTYILQVTDSQNGCTATASQQVVQDLNAPTAVAAQPGELTCKVLSVNLNGVGSTVGNQIEYLWTSTNGNIVSGTTSLNPTVDEPGIYKLIITNKDNGCTAATTVNVLENVAKPAADAGNLGFLTCTKTTASLAGTGSGGTAGVSYFWSASNGGVIISGENTPTPTVNSAGIFTLIITDNYNGCTQSDQTQVLADVAPPLVAIAQPNILTCKILQIPLDAAGTSTGADFQYSWSGAGLVAGETTLFPTVNEPGNYNLLVTNLDNGCTKTSSILVSEDIKLPTAEAGNGFTINCETVEGNLDAAGTSTGQNFVYQWNSPDGNIVSGATTLNPLVNLQGNYNLQVTNVLNGCTSSDAVEVLLSTDVPTGLEVRSDPPNCTGKKGEMKIENIVGGVGPFLYSLDGGQSFAANPKFHNLPPGTYNLLIQDVNGCEIGQEITFPTPVLPTVEVDPELKLAFGENGKITAQSNLPLSEIDSVIWSPTEGLTFTANPLEVIAQPASNTQYTVTIINKDGCEDRAKINVKVDQPAIWVPNVIQTKSLLGNDHFTIYSKEGTILKINTLQIYDRWGEHVFQAKDFLPNDPKFGWDGSFEGKLMTPAVFVWWAEITLTDGSIIFMEGDVTVAD